MSAGPTAQAVRRPTAGVGFFVLLGALSAAAPAAMDMYTPALPQVADDLGTSTSSAQLTIALFLVGLALGQLVFGELSDVFGRRRPLLVGLALFTVSSILCASATTLPLLCLGRILQGAAGASGIVIARSIVRDLYGLEDSARYYSRLTLIYGVAPMVAPLIGSAVAGATSWHGVFVANAIFGVLLVSAVALKLPETLAPELRRSGSPAAARAAYATLLRDRVYVGCIVTTGLMATVLTAYVSMTPFLVTDRYGGSPQLFAILFGVNGLVMVASSQINAHLLHRVGLATLTRVGLALLLAGCAGLAAVAVGGLGLIALEASLMLLVASWGFSQGNLVAIGLANHTRIAGAGSALMGLTQFALAAAIAPLAGIGGSSSVAPMATIAVIGGLGATGAALFVLGRRSAAPLPEVSACPS
ncbi:multidrug effflux MFS transporter [Conexibacter sp. CPCC 206217]|uniref:multidrug effflux MFS transporter n=1 Tax=Conexibacter sp. CPCC 206217 TaxID=3064574 RepID=UPI0027206805|nr:multidrug effflux MFS transporter [Conexibacter sp. CPCC 206217]MDO8213176.1 multidrug effflux MFS transporter [Conexibacter sp. CPCC 206217]